MRTALALTLALAAMTAFGVADTASAAYAEITECPDGFVGAGVYASPPGRGAQVCCKVGLVGAACLRP